MVDIFASIDNSIRMVLVPFCPIKGTYSDICNRIRY